MNLLKPIEDTEESFIRDVMLDMSGPVAASIIGDPTGLAAVVFPRFIKWILHHAILPLTSPSESKRLYQWGKQAAIGIAQRLNAGEEFRKDGFFEETPTNRSNFEEVIESTLKMVIDATEEPKIKFIAYLTENVHLNEDLDINTYRQILKALDELSYRQLCIIRLVILCEDEKVAMDSIGEAEGEKWIEQKSKDEQMRINFISREYENLANNKYFEVDNPIRHSRIQPPLLLLGPNIARSTFYTLRLHSFTRLNEIPIEDIEQTFSIWNVRRRVET